MKGQKKLEWIKEGYRMVSEQGFASLSIESIARAIGKNKSSFYHYFGDAELFETELLEHHLKCADEFTHQAGQCNNIRPDLVNLFVAHQTDLFFHKQLRIHRGNPEFKKCFEKVFDLYEHAIMDQWAEFLGLAEKRIFARTFLHLMADNFLLQITPTSYNYEWLDNYLKDISIALLQMNAGNEK